MFNLWPSTQVSKIWRQGKNGRGAVAFKTSTFCHCQISKPLMAGQSRAMPLPPAWLEWGLVHTCFLLYLGWSQAIPPSLHKPCWDWAMTPPPEQPCPFTPPVGLSWGQAKLSSAHAAGLRQDCPLPHLPWHWIRTTSWIWPVDRKARWAKKLSTTGLDQ